MVRVVRELRETHDFRGYIHLKTIPDADPLLIDEAGRYADRLSINVELPTEPSLRRLAPEKEPAQIRKAMAGSARATRRRARARRAASAALRAAGQSTQMIVGADAASDATSCA
jgi:predicted DNA-binding helix-hairpin-helix protein